MRLLVLQPTSDDADTTPLNWRESEAKAMGLRSDMPASELRVILRRNGYLLIDDELTDRGTTRMLTVVHRNDDCRDPDRAPPPYEIGGEA